MTKRITAVRFENYRRLNEVEIHPEADCALVLIGGANGNGKSSLLGALSAAFGGKKMLPPDPVRHGAPEAALLVQLGGDGGDLEIRRRIQPDGETVLEVRDQHGAVRSPQAVLDKLIGSRFLDPLTFLRLKGPEQRAALMKVIPGADRIAKIDESRKRVFDQRTEAGRDLTKAEGELARLPPARPVPELIDVAALNEEARQLAEQQGAGHGIEARLSECQRETRHAEAQLAAVHAEGQRVQAEIARLQERLAELQRLEEERSRELDACSSRVRLAAAQVDAAARAWKEAAPRRARVDSDLKRAGEHNRAVYEVQAEVKRRHEVESVVAQLRKLTEEQTAVIAEFDRDKAAILAEAMLPVDSLAIGEQGIMLGGVPFEQASDSERLRTALAIAAAASPELDDIWIRDGSLLDEQSLELVAKHAAATGRRVWIERVGTRDPGVIEIRDGRVIEPKGDRQ